MRTAAAIVILFFGSSTCEAVKPTKRQRATSYTPHQSIGHEKHKHPLAQDLPVTLLCHQAKNLSNQLTQLQAHEFSSSITHELNSHQLNPLQLVTPSSQIKILNRIPKLSTRCSHPVIVTNLCVHPKSTHELNILLSILLPVIKSTSYHTPNGAPSSLGAMPSISSI